MELMEKWKSKKVFCITPDGMGLIAPVDIPQGEDYDEYRRMSRAIFDFRPDSMLEIPESPKNFAVQNSAISSNFYILRLPITEH